MLNRFKVAKHFDIEITDQALRYQRREAAIAAEQRLDGVYVVCISVAAERLGAAQAVLAYKSLVRVERAFRCLKTVDLQICPIYHRLGPRVRAHVFLCVLAYYAEWHMRRDWAPLLYGEDDPAGAQAARTTRPGRRRRGRPGRGAGGAELAGAAGAQVAAGRRPTGTSCMVSGACWRTWRP